MNYKLQTLLTVATLAAAPSCYAQALPAGQDSGAETLFVMTNKADRNEVVAYTGDRSGAFREAHRFSTGGRGSGNSIPDPLNSQGALTLSQDRSLLFAVNPGTSDLSVFRVHGGDLVLVDKLPTGGALPVSVTQRGNLVYVLNQGGTGTITGFNLRSDGKLRRIPGSTGSLSANTVAGTQVGISPDGQFLVAVEQLTDPFGAFPHRNYISTFKINGDGTLAPPVRTPAAVTPAFSFSFTPAGQVLVTDAGFVPAGPPLFNSGVTSYKIRPNGSLAPITAYAPSTGLGPCWSVLSADGTHFYVANTISGDITGYLVASDGSLTLMGSTSLGTNPPKSASLDLSLSVDGKLLYNLNPGSNTIGVYAVNADGTLSTLPPIKVPSAVTFSGLAAL